jgi:hypothetical protein
MRVRELIAKLQEMDPEAFVYTNKTECCEAYREVHSEDVWATVETERDYSKRYNAPDAYQTIESVRIG